METGMPDITTLAQQRTNQQDQAKTLAFKAFQDAARTKDEDPATFEAAKMRYYSLKNGPSWTEQEKKRISGTKIDPIIAQFRDMYNSLTSEQGVQKAYTDSVATIRDQQQSLTDNAGKHVSYFGKLIDQEKQKKSAYNRLVELTSQTSPAASPIPSDIPPIVKYFSGYPSSFSIILDVMLAVLILFILYLGLRKSALARTGHHAMWSSIFTSGSIPFISPYSPRITPFSPTLGTVRAATFRQPNT
jgi:hypothetical protein